MCDVTRKQTLLEGARLWKKSADESVFLPNGQPIPSVLLVNKVRSSFCLSVLDGIAYALCVMKFSLHTHNSSLEGATELKFASFCSP